MGQVELVAEDIYQLAQGIWETLFADHLEVAGEELAEPSGFISGCIQITGAWEGVVALRSSLALARELACTMLALDAPEDADLCDAMGELANLTAGAVQPLLPSPSELTPPSVVKGKDYKLIFPRCSIVNEVHFRFHSQPLTVTVFEANHDSCARTTAEPRCSLAD